MTTLVLFLLIFLAAGLTLLAANLVLGRFVRPDRPSAAKSEVYECGEQPVGPSWIQFDLRFYVVALLFVIFDVELAFFFPWAVVFGSATQLANPELSATQRNEIEARFRQPGQRADKVDPFEHVDAHKHGPNPSIHAATDAPAAKKLAWIAFADVMVFFGVLLVGFAYLWRRGDLEWVRSLAAQGAPPRQADVPGEVVP